jgi:hypothetical protein
VFPTTRTGAGAIFCPLYKSAKNDKPTEDFIGNPLSYARISQHLVGTFIKPSHNNNNNNGREGHISGGLLTGKTKDKYGSLSSGSYVAFFFGLKMSWVNTHLLEDGSMRLWNGDCLIFDRFDFACFCLCVCVCV